MVCYDRFLLYYVNLYIYNRIRDTRKVPKDMT